MSGLLQKLYSFLFPFRKTVSEIFAVLAEISAEQNAIRRGIRELKSALAEQEQFRQQLSQTCGHIREEQEQFRQQLFQICGRIREEQEQFRQRLRQALDRLQSEQEKLSLREEELARAMSANVNALGKHLNVISDTQNAHQQEVLGYVKGLIHTANKIFDLATASRTLLADGNELVRAVDANVNALGKHLNVISDTQNAHRQEALGYVKGLIHTADKIFDLATASRTLLADGQGREEAGLANLLRRTDELEETEREQAQNLQELQKQTIRSVIQAKWRLSDDFAAPRKERQERIIRCPLCGHSGRKSAYETKLSFCIFGGGRLERFVCPACDLIFGPLKMLELSPRQLQEEYEQNYSVFRESDTEPYERALFYAMKPEKERVYLNYGAGGWNATSRRLREEGFQVYDYEPFAPVRKEEWIITAKERLREMRFDGIFSNDLIEHLQFPVEELRFMNSILKPGGKMFHATGCYEYAFEYTRFHLFFFTGRSLRLLAQKCGMEVELTDRIYPERSSLRYAIFTKEGPECGVEQK